MGDSPSVSILCLYQITETDAFIVFWLTSWLTFRVNHSVNRPNPAIRIKNKKPRQSFDYQGFLSVGMTGFEPATTRPPDAYSNRAELHPAWVLLCKGRTNFSNRNGFLKKILKISDFFFQLALFYTSSRSFYTPQ